jgi:prepilin-type N-terminal cleavage/methylation domain-containing protein
MMPIGSMKRGRCWNTRRAVTLVELLMVLAIAVVLIGVGGYLYIAHQSRVKRDAAQQKLAKLTHAAEEYRQKHGEFPSNLVRLTKPDSDNEQPYVVSEELLSPWGTEYQYDPHGRNHGGSRPDVWAETPDGPLGNW